MRLIQRAFAALIATALLVAGLIFASAFFALAAVLALGLWLWLWIQWRMRAVRRTADCVEAGCGMRFAGACELWASGCARAKATRPTTGSKVERRMLILPG